MRLLTISLAIVTKTYLVHNAYAIGARDFVIQPDTQIEAVMDQVAEVDIPIENKIDEQEGQSSIDMENLAQAIEEPRSQPQKETLASIEATGGIAALTTV